MGIDAAEIGSRQALLPKSKTATVLGDVRAGFVVFLIALPLSIGIALAAGAPPTAGILGAVIGGILGSLVTGSYLTINGPAAGLIVIVMGAIHDLGGGDLKVGFPRMLAALVFAGVIQAVFGLLRCGVLGLAVPGSVIHGMLTAIGMIIMVKQLPVALGVVSTAKTIPDMIAAIPHTVSSLNPEVALIALVGFYIILYMGQARGAIARWVPAPLIVIVVGVAMAHLFDFEHVHLVKSHWLEFTADERLLLNLPNNLVTALVFPDFSQLGTWENWRYVIEFALVGSIESILSAAAVDRMDPLHRNSNLDRELIGKGFCNVVCGLVGGLPIIAEMVRSTANIKNGARTRVANFSHGIFILAALLLIPSLLHLIPLAALAAILMSVGYSLAHPSQLLKTAKVGRDHLAAYIVTLLVTLFSDLLIGVFAGILVEVGFNLWRGSSIRGLFRVRFLVDEQPNQLTLHVHSPLVFTNYLRIRRQIERMTNGGTTDVSLDLSLSQVIDHTVLDQLNRLERDLAKSGLSFQIRFADDHVAVSKHPLAARRLAKSKVGVAATTSGGK